MAGRRDAFVEHCLELLGPLGPTRARRMFGGHGLYVGDLFVAIVSGERLYLKADAGTAPRFAAAACEPFVYTAKGRTVTLGYWAPPAEAMDSPSSMAPWGRLAMQAALQARAARSDPGRLAGESADSSPGGSAGEAAVRPVARPRRAGAVKRPLPGSRRAR